MDEKQKFTVVSEVGEENCGLIKKKYFHPFLKTDET